MHRQNILANVFFCFLSFSINLNQIYFFISLNRWAMKLTWAISRWRRGQSARPPASTLSAHRCEMCDRLQLLYQPCSCTCPWTLWTSHLHTHTARDRQIDHYFEYFFPNVFQWICFVVVFICSIECRLNETESYTCNGGEYDLEENSDSERPLTEVGSGYQSHGRHHFTD